MKQKQRFSLRTNKIGTASVLLGLTIIGGTYYGGTQVKAAEVYKETNVKEVKDVKANENQELAIAKKNEVDKLKAKNEAVKKVQDAQNKLSEADKDVTTKKKELFLIGKAKEQLKEAEKLVNKKQKEKDVAIDVLNKAKNENIDIEKREEEANANLNNKKQNRDEKQRLLDEAKRKQKEADDALKNAFPYPTKLIATQEWLDAFNKFRSIHNEEFDLDAWKAKNPITDDTDPEEYGARMDKAMDEFFADKNSRELNMIKKLQVLENSQPSPYSLKYGNKTDDKITYEINNLPQDVLLELSQYFAHLVNDARSQLGISDKIKVHLDAIEFAKEVAKSVVDNNATVDGHFGRGINDAARKRGLATSADSGVDTEKQYYENLMVSKRSDKTVTRSELFAYLYRYFDIFMHEGQLSGHYNHALSLISSKNVGVSFSHLQDGTFKLHAISINPGFIKNDKNDVEYEKRYGAATLLDNVDYPDRDVLQKAYDDAIKNVEKATQELDKATKDISKAQDKINELNKIKEKVKNAEVELKLVTKKLFDANQEKIKAEVNLKNLTVNQYAKEKALNEALTVQRQKYGELNKAKANLAKAQKEYDNAVQIRKLRERSGWIKENGAWYYYKNGNVVRNAWVGNYWLGADGKMATNAWVDNNRYYVGNNGEWIKGYQNKAGWIKENGAWYYYKNGNVVRNAWAGNYWLGADGKMVINSRVDNNRYYVGNDGKWIPGK